MQRTLPAHAFPARHDSAPAHPSRRAVRFAWDMGVVLAMMALYFIARGQAPAPVPDAVTRTTHIIAFERALHIFAEPAIQHASISHHWTRELANFVYAYLHFPVMGAVAVWLWWRGRERFLFIRNVLFISMAAGLVFYYLLPAAPPRLMAAHGYDFGFTDTVFGGHTAVHYAHPSLITNEYAAIPSFHFGWILLSAAAIWISTRNPVARGGAVVLTVLMGWAIVASANHLFVDMALGVLVIALSWAAAWLLHRPDAGAVLPLTPAPAPAPVLAEPHPHRAA